MLKPTTSRNKRSHSTTPGTLFGLLAFALFVLVAATPVSSLKLTSDANANGYSVTNIANLQATNGYFNHLTATNGISGPLDWSNITNAPTTTAGYGITNLTTLALTPPTNVPGAGEFLGTDGTNFFWGEAAGGGSFPLAAVTMPEVLITDPSSNTILGFDSNGNIYLQENLSGSAHTVGFDSSGNILLSGPATISYTTSATPPALHIVNPGGYGSQPNLLLEGTTGSAYSMMESDASGGAAAFEYKNTATSVLWYEGLGPWDGSNDFEIANGSGVVFEISNSTSAITCVSSVTCTAIILTGSAPGSSSAAGVAGQIAYDANYLYVCVGTSSWKRVALSSF
jgi:hypothetical protein